MKKLVAVVTVAVLFGCASCVFAQVPGAQQYVQAMGEMHAAKVAQQQIKDNAFISQIQHNGTPGAFSYSFTLMPYVFGGYGQPGIGAVQKRHYPTSGYIPGYVLVSGKKVHILISHDNWKGMLSCISSSSIIDEQTLTFKNGEQFSYMGSRKLPAKDYHVNGKAYTVITLPVSPKK